MHAGLSGAEAGLPLLRELLAPGDDALADLVEREPRRLRERVGLGLARVVGVDEVEEGLAVFAVLREVEVGAGRRALVVEEQDRRRLPDRTEPPATRHGDPVRDRQRVEL